MIEGVGGPRASGYNGLECSKWASGARDERRSLCLSGAKTGQWETRALGVFQLQFGNPALSLQEVTSSWSRRTRASPPAPFSEVHCPHRFLAQHLPCQPPFLFLLFSKVWFTVFTPTLGPSAILSA